MKNIIFFFFAVTLAINSNAQETKYNPLLFGKWLSEDGDAIINVYEENGKIFGKIIWLKEPNNEEGHPKVDEKNPNPELRRRKKLGLVIMTDFVYKKGLQWTDGEIYDPKSGNTYDANIELKDKNTLSLRGYIGISLIGRTSVWTKVEEEN